MCRLRNGDGPLEYRRPIGEAFHQPRVLLQVGRRDMLHRQSCPHHVRALARHAFGKLRFVPRLERRPRGGEPQPRFQFCRGELRRPLRRDHGDELVQPGNRPPLGAVRQPAAPGVEQLDAPRGPAVGEMPQRCGRGQPHGQVVGAAILGPLTSRSNNRCDSPSCAAGAMRNRANSGE